MVRSISVDSNGMKKGAWTEEEDNKLSAYVQRYGHWNWRLLPKYAGLARCGKSCRLRWMNYLKPGVKRGKFSKKEEDLVVELHAQMGNKWSAIAGKLPGRTDNEVKNFWHTRIEKRNSKRNPTAKNKGHTNEACRIEGLEEHKSSEAQRDLPSKDAFVKPENSLESLDTKFSDHSIAEFQEFDFWIDPFLPDTTDHYNQNEYFSQVHYEPVSCSDSSYLSATAWIREYDQSPISTDHDKNFQENLWNELFVSNFQIL